MRHAPSNGGRGGSKGAAMAAPRALIFLSKGPFPPYPPAAYARTAWYPVRSRPQLRFFSAEPETALRYLDLKKHATPVLPAFPDRKPGDREDLADQE